MMEAAFLKLLNLSISASWLICAVILLRFLLRRTPKWMICLLWGLVGIRLVCPFSLESAFSLIPSAETIPQNIIWAHSPAINSGIPVINQVLNPAIAASFSPDPAASANPLQIVAYIASMIWAVGTAAMLLYLLCSYFRIKRRVRTATLRFSNIWQSEYVKSPFILGILKPRIYIPYHLDKQDFENIIAHEKAHLKRHDHFTKPIAFIILAVYWFNPLVWLAYILLCCDIELACDEKVIKTMDKTERKSYSKTLLGYETDHHSAAACPLAFGEVGVKERIKNVMCYKKPIVITVVASMLLCVLVGICFLTSPKSNTDKNKPVPNVGEYQMVLSDSELPIAPSLTLQNDGTFDFSYDVLSSYMPYGSYEIKEHLLTATTYDSKFSYYFEIIDENTLRFLKNRSEDDHLQDAVFHEIPDKAVFKRITD